MSLPSLFHLHRQAWAKKNPHSGPHRFQAPGLHKDRLPRQRLWKVISAMAMAKDKGIGLFQVSFTAKNRIGKLLTVIR